MQGIAIPHTSYCSQTAVAIQRKLHILQIAHAETVTRITVLYLVGSIDFISSVMALQ